MKRNRWGVLIALVAVLALIPVAFLLGHKQQGLLSSYSEREALSDANGFMRCLEGGDYAKAYTYLDLEDKKHEWLERWFTEEELTDFEADGLEKFCELGKSKVEALGGIEDYTYVDTNSQYAFDYRGNRVYNIRYKVRFQGKDEDFSVQITENGICGIGAADGYLQHPLVQFCIWSEWLWQEYQGCYYDFNSKTYVYYDQES